MNVWFDCVSLVTAFSCQVCKLTFFSFVVFSQFVSDLCHPHPSFPSFSVSSFSTCLSAQDLEDFQLCDDSLFKDIFIGTIFKALLNVTIQLLFYVWALARHYFEVERGFERKSIQVREKTNKLTLQSFPPRQPEGNRFEHNERSFASSAECSFLFLCSYSWFQKYP